MHVRTAEAPGFLPRLFTLVAALTAAAALSAGCPDGGRTTIPVGNDGFIFGGDNDSNTGGDSTTPDGVTPDDGPQDTGSDVLPTNIPCQQDQNCPGQVPFCGDDNLCKQCLSGNDCVEGTCESGFCLSENCTPDATRCDGATQLVCNATGTGWISAPCSSGTCANGQCTLCAPGAAVCQGLSLVQCAADGQSTTEIQNCADTDELCLDGACRSCAPGQSQCNGEAVETCNAQGQFELSENCEDAGSTCVLGKCLDPCELEVKDSNAGCDYWAVNTDNISSAVQSPNYQYSVVVANTQDVAVDVRVLQKTSAAGAEVEVLTRTVAPGGLEILNLATAVNNAAGVFFTSYRIRSTGPIIAAQFNPLENINVFSNDASLLLPSNTFGQEYITSSRQEITSGGGDQWRGWAAVVAAQDDTTVTIQPTVALLAGSGVQAMVPGSTYQVSIGQFQVLNLKSNATGGDMTGTIITADKPIGVYSGHDAVASSNKCCADHLEHQLFPVETWGTEYVAGRTFPRGQESDYWRVIAAEDGTTVTFEPAVEPAHTLNRGEWFEFATTEDFVVSADKPISLTQTMASSLEVLDVPNFCLATSECPAGWQCLGALPPLVPGDCIKLCTAGGNECDSGFVCKTDELTPYCRAIGDPAMILVPPTNQWRADYVFLAPNKYLRDYVNILAPQAAAVVLDGTNVPAGNFQTVPGTGYKVGRILVNDGVHTLTADTPVGLVSYGYDIDVSYGYTAGLNLEFEQ